MNSNGLDLAALARQEMIAEGFQPDFPPGADQQLAAIEARPAPAPSGECQDLRHLLWSSIDNDSSRDLDQVEYAERKDGAIRVLVAIADVSGAVEPGTPIDQHAAGQTVTVYTGVRNFSMLPEKLSTDLTSLNEDGDRMAVVVEITVAADGAIAAGSIYPALVRNHAKLAYDSVGAWLEDRGPAPPEVAGSAALQAQLRLHDEAAHLLREHRHRLGALSLDRAELQTVVSDGHVTGIAAHRRNRATDLIEDFMIAANEVMARRLSDARVASIRRVVKTPDRWPRIVELAAQYGERLPAEPDSAALDAFLRKRRAADPDHYADVSLSVVKLMGPGEYVMSRPGEPGEGHFALATRDYTHSTAPNRRFADLVTQRIIKAVLAGRPEPYSAADLSAIARNCTLKEDAARKVERAMQKRVAAVAMQPRIGETFPAVVTGVTHKGVFVRVFDPPVEGKLVRGEEGVDVGDRLQVILVAADPQRGFIDFANAATASATTIPR